MRFFSSFTFFFLVLFNLQAQVTTNPTFPKAGQPVTFTIDVTGTGLQGYTDKVWIWTWVAKGCASNCDAPTNVNPATDAQNAALATRSASNPNIYTITFTPTDFFQKPAGEIERIGLLLKGRDWSNGQTPDYFVEMATGEFQVLFTSPTKSPVFLSPGETLELDATTSEAALIKLYINDVEVASQADATQIAHTFTAGEAGKFIVKATAESAGNIIADSTYFIVSAPAVTEERPSGVVAGINYFEPDPSKVTLDLWAPQKSSVYVIGDFTNWEVEPDYQMKKDGEHFWLEVTGLEPGIEYGYQYLVDEEVFIADPFADKILDPDDQYIPAAVYPGLKEYPAGALHEEWFFNRVSVLQTAQSAYQWETERLQLAADSLVIYELLIRDFFEDGERSYANLIDTLSYLKALGVNAVELMPVMEFNGNSSWGYNPTFMFAPDKYYGPKDELKAFIDEAHKLDMAVILDIAMNHNDIPNSFLAMYFDYNTFKPTADNPFFNVKAKHPFNVFYDFNHESPYTQQYLDTINNYWINEYRIDGFRYDLSKGFTQVDYGNDVSAWSSYDASRIALLSRMKSEIREYAPNVLLILEHFANNTEEKELAEDGFLLWGNLNHSYSQAAMGYASGADISWGYYGTRNWTSPNLITYMESHDEERVAFRVKQYGNSSGGYSTKVLEERIKRLKAAAAFLYTLPGPKMMWQWEEWGYEIPIDENGRTGIKPIPWNNIDGLNYNNSPEHTELYIFYKALLNLRREHPLFSFGNAEIINNSNVLLKQVNILNTNYTDSPATPEQMNAFVIGNFDVTEKSITANLPHAGQWYNYFSHKGDLNTTSTTATITLAPGEFRLYTDVRLEEPPELVTGINKEPSDFGWYPNPVREIINVKSRGAGRLTIYDQQGRKVFAAALSDGSNEISLVSVSKGLYIAELLSTNGITSFKIIKQ